MRGRTDLPRTARDPGRRRGAIVVTLAVLVALVALGLSACSSGGDALVVYSGRTENLIGPLIARFEDETGIDVTVEYDQSANLALRVDTEGDRSPADVFISQSPGATGFLAGRGRLATLDADLVDRVPDEFRSPDGAWVGLTGRVRVLVYNTEMVDPDTLPDSVFDLTAREYRGKVGIAPANGSFQDFVTGMRALVGDDATLEWLTAMNDNLARTYANNTAILEAVKRGEIPMGLVNHYYNERAKAEDPSTPTENHFFAAGDPGTLILVTAAGVVDTTDRPEEAQRLVELLLSADAQEFFSTETFEYPLAAGVHPAVDLPPLDEIVSPQVDLSKLGGELERTRELIVESGLESG